MRLINPPTAPYGLGDFHQAPTPPASTAPDALAAVCDDGGGGGNKSTELD